MLEEAKIKPYVFNQSVELFLIKADNTVENLLETTKLSLYSLFTVASPHDELSCDQASTLLAEVTDTAYALVSRQDIMGQIKSRIELFVAFDSFLQDYVLFEKQMSADQFRAIIF